MKLLRISFLLTALFLTSSLANADWPEATWLNRPPNSGANLYAVAFCSPADLQIYKMMGVWKKLAKHYADQNVDFLIVAMKEEGIPYDNQAVTDIVNEWGYTLPVYLDSTGAYSKLWRAYVTPTVNLVLKNNHVTSFDPGNFDPAYFEKTLQRILKENGTPILPPRAFNLDGEAKTCGHSNTIFLGDKHQKSWSAAATIEGWNTTPFWLEKTGTKVAHIEALTSRPSVGLIASTEKASAKIIVTLDGEKIPLEFRGRDVQEDKSGATYISVHLPRNYEVTSHNLVTKEGGSKINFSTEAKDLKVWGYETLPKCQETPQ